ncbi:MAG: hypothetical protein CL661_04175 [Bacteroidetes bacterium]|nr:hypothetical protein [Bacteroidota bacterium]
MFCLFLQKIFNIKIRNKILIMKYSIIVAYLCIITLIVSCTSNTKTNSEEKKSDDDVRVSYIFQNDKQAKSLKKRGATVTTISKVALGKALKKAMKKGGLEYALDFCKHEAIKITDSLSNAEGVDIKRVAQKNRNPNNKANAIESKIFKQYIMEWLTNKTLQPKLAINENGHPVYYKPIILTKNCLVCHGKPGEDIPEDISAKISELYPDDKAINFEDGHPRGMWAITFMEVTANTN